MKRSRNLGRVTRYRWFESGFLQRRVEQTSNRVGLLGRLDLFSRTPASWPIGRRRDCLGTYDLFAHALLLFERGSYAKDWGVVPAQFYSGRVPDYP